MYWHINKIIIDESNNFMYMPLAQGSCTQQDF